MRILYVDIDSLRPDHLGCYGYHRNTSPRIDAVARQGVRFENAHVSDAPCLPSRTSLFTGRFGIHTGVINHGGVASEPFVEGPGRSFRSVIGVSSWMPMLRKAGLRTATVSPFGERHSAWHWYAGFNDIHNTGKLGMETADEIAPPALEWIARHGKSDNWFLHVNFWDPHTAYRTPSSFGDPFKNEPLPAWLTEEVRQSHWQGCGPHSAQEIAGFAPHQRAEYPRQPVLADSMASVRRMFDGYDTGVRYADHHVGMLLDALEKQGVLGETAIVISSDHGENLGELNIYGDHQTADLITTRVPLIVRWPGVTAAGKADDGLHYHFDFAATMIELLGQEVPGCWDGRSFAPALRVGRLGPDSGREYLVVSQGAWSCQRGVRFREEGKEYFCLRSYHDGYHGLPDVMLFDVEEDRHEQADLAGVLPETTARALAMLEAWHGQMMRSATHPRDPMWTVIHEGGAFHTRRALPKYLDRLRATGRSNRADDLAAKHPRDCAM